MERHYPQDFQNAMAFMKSHRQCLQQQRVAHLQAQLVDGAGRPVDDRRVHLARAKAWDHTVASGDAVLVRFRWPGGAGRGSASAVRVRLLHRSRSATVARTDRHGRPVPYPQLTVSRIERDPSALGAAILPIRSRLFEAGGAL